MMYLEYGLVLRVSRVVSLPNMLTMVSVIFVIKLIIAEI